MKILLTHFDNYGIPGYKTVGEASRTFFQEKEKREEMRYSRLLMSLGVLMAALWATPSYGGKKKLIEMGADNPDTLWMRDNIASMEQATFDGCVCILTSDSRRLPPYDGSDLGDFSYWQWSDRQFTYAELQEGIDAIGDTNFNRFTDVFMPSTFFSVESTWP